MCFYTINTLESMLIKLKLMTLDRHKEILPYRVSSGKSAAIDREKVQHSS